MKHLILIPVLIQIAIVFATPTLASEPAATPRDEEQRALDYLLETLDREDASARGGMPDPTANGKRLCARAATAFLLETHPQRDAYRADRRRLQAQLLAFLDQKNVFVQRTWLYGFISLWLAEKGLQGDDVSEPYAKLVRHLEQLQNAEGGWSHGWALDIPIYPTTVVAATNWSVFAHGMAGRLGIEVEEKAVARAVALLEDIQGACGAFPYGGRTYRKGYEAGRTAGAVVALAALGRQESEAFRLAAEYVLRDVSAVPCGHASPSMHVLMGALASRLLGDEAWARWDDEVLGVVRRHQRRNGTFDILVTGAQSGISVGMKDVASDLYVTACCAAALAMPHSKLAHELAADVPLPASTGVPEPSPLETAWSIETSANATFTAAAGCVFLHEGETGLHGLRGDDGTVLYTTPIAPADAKAPQPARVNPTQTHVYVLLHKEPVKYPQTAPLTLVACRPADGTPRWTVELDSPPVAAGEGDGRLYLRLLRGRFLVLSVEDGSEIENEAPKTAMMNAGLWVRPDAGIVRSVQADLEVRDFEENLIWERKEPAEPGINPPVVSAAAWLDSRILVARSDGAITAYDPADGCRLWGRSLGSGILSLAPLGPDGPLLVRDFEGVVCALRAADGEELWRFATPRVREHTRPDPAYGRDGLVVVGSPGDERTFFLDPATGAIRHVLRTSPHAQVAVDAGLIYVLDHGRLWALRHAPKAAPEPTAEADLAEARRRATEGDVEGAVALLRESLERNPEVGELAACLARMLYDAGAYETAAEAYEEAAYLGALDGEGAVYHGHCYVALGQLERARSAYVDGILRNPESDAPLRGGLLHLAGGDWAKVEGWLREDIETSPEGWALHYRLGLILLKQDRLDEAREALAAAWSHDDASTDVGVLLGWVEEKRGAGEAACACYRRVLEADPGHQAAALRWEIQLRNREAPLEDLQPEYEVLLRLAPDDPDVRNNYAFRLRDRAERLQASETDGTPQRARVLYERSRDVYTEAARMLPDDPQVQSDTGLVYEFYPAVRDDEIAARYFRRALELTDYTYRDALNGMVRICERSEDWEQLRQVVTRALERFDAGKGALVPKNSGGIVELGPEQTSWVSECLRLGLAHAEAELGLRDTLQTVPPLELEHEPSFEGFALPEDWTIERPASEPKGDPVVLRYAFEAGAEYVLEAEAEGTMRQRTTEIPLRLWRTLHVKTAGPGSVEAGTPVSARVRLAQGKADQALERVCNARVRPTGRIEPGTLRIPHDGQHMAVELAQPFRSALPLLPDRPVRVGEIWAVPYETYAAGCATIPYGKGTVHAEAWSTLEGFETVDGVRCARIRTVFQTACRSDDHGYKPRMTHAATTLLRGQSTLLLGEDGWIRTYEEHHEFLHRRAEKRLAGVLDLHQELHLTARGKIVPVETEEVKTTQGDELDTP